MFSAIPLRGAQPQTLRRLLEGVLVALLAVQAARLVWLIVTPSGPLGVPASSRTQTADLGVLSRFDPFFRAGAPAMANHPTTSADDAATLGLRLFGVRAGLVGEKGSAIIAAPDGRQASYAVGDEVTPGVVLAAVRGDHVILGRGAERLRLSFPQVAAAAPATDAPAPAAAAGNPASGPSRLMLPSLVEPKMMGDRMVGVAVKAGAGGAALAAAGLQPGDVLISVNGKPLNSQDRVNELGEEMSKAPESELRFERGGQVMTTRVSGRP